MGTEFCGCFIIKSRKTPSPMVSFSLDMQDLHGIIFFVKLVNANTNELQKLKVSYENPQQDI